MYPHVFPDPEIFLKNIHTAIFHTTVVQDPKRTTLKKKYHKSSQKAVVLQYYSAMWSVGTVSFTFTVSPAHTFGLHFVRLCLHQSPGVYTLPCSCFKL